MFLNTDIFLVCGFSVFSSSQYFSPYVSADMTKMAQAFNTTVTALEDELTQLILEGLINARIDSHSKVKTLHTSNRCHRYFVVWTLTNWDSDLLVDSVCEGCRPKEHHIWEVSSYGQRVPETSQSHDSPCCCAAQPDSRQGRDIFFSSHCSE